MSDCINIIIVGVGGQGSLLASRILGNYYLSLGLDVKVSEVHGMAQRGGSVVTYVRAGKQVASPLVSAGDADVIISFEELEALRQAHNLKKDGKIIVSTQRIMPMPVLTGAAKYPQDAIEQLRSSGIDVTAVDALALAVAAGGAKAANVALMGAASLLLGGNPADWERVLASTVPAKFLELNLAAFRSGAGRH